MNLTHEQEEWMRHNGGRSHDDIQLDDRGMMYVLMYSPDAMNRMERVYLPFQQSTPSQEIKEMPRQDDIITL